MSVDLKKQQTDYGFLRFFAENVNVPCTDVDQIVHDRAGNPVAIIESTHCYTRPSNPGYQRALDERMNGSLQKRTVLKVAAALGVPAYWVTFTPDFLAFGIRRLDAEYAWEARWITYTQEQFLDWVHQLKTVAA